jgi:ribonucleoside-diphosphate reductase alpha chain
MTVAPPNNRLGLRRVFTSEGQDPFDSVQWDHRDAVITDYRTGEEAFRQNGVEFPQHWSVNASNIVTQKYFRGHVGDSGREDSLRQVIGRVADTITEWGEADGYFGDAADRATFNAELKYLLVNQMMAFNSPVWFNIGVPGAPRQASACFILAVEDSLDSILNWYAEEGVIFKGGSGAGVNLSAIRSSKERLNGGGTPSGPVSFMRGADASAGTIKSGGKTRRAAKMVVLDVSHPDVEEFIWCKALEERKARVLEAAGFDMGVDGSDGHSIQYQNANNSVRLSDAFMQAVVDGGPWDLRSVTDGSLVETVDAKALFHQIADAAWQCADPGVQFDTTINRWHTAPATGPINASNPCSEYMHIDNSACNLASLNLLTFCDEEGNFDVERFCHAVRITILAQEILVGNADYPTQKIGDNSRKFRQLGLGFANLGALLMSLGLAYDSDEGRAWAGAITALMTGEAYAASADIAERMGPFAGYAANRPHMLRVLDMHRAALSEIDRTLAPLNVLDAASSSWSSACEKASIVGVRNAQATVLAPTGTISFMMDCDTTGIEPDLALVKTKKLVGGGTMSIVNRSVPRALRRMGYLDNEIEAIVAYIDANRSVIGAPHLRPEHLAVFACSMGDNVIDADGHISMMAACQPFLSGAISKTVNLPETVSVEDVEQLLIRSWRLGLKAVAIYRDNCKVGQPLSATSDDETSNVDPSAGASIKPADIEAAVAAAIASAKRVPERERLPRSRSSKTLEFRVADCKGFATIGEYDDGRPGELFVRVSKQGSTLAGIMDAFAIAVSHGLQYGVPLSAYVRAFVGMRFEPAGMTDDPEVRIANSLMDYLFRRLAIEYLSFDERSGLGIYTTEERSQPTLPGVEEAATQSQQGLDIEANPPSAVSETPAPTPTPTPHMAATADPSAPLCMQCGVQMVRAGSCHVCIECGMTSGCS